MTANRQLSMAELEAGLERIRQSPRRPGVLELIVRRPGVDQREVLEQAELDPVQGLIGDRWTSHRGSNDSQLAIMNSRVIALLAHSQDHWPLAGDQLFVDLDLSQENLPPGTRIGLGSAVIEVTAEPHTGCQKFAARYGLPALRFINSPALKSLHLRGIYARVVQAGTIHVGDTLMPMQ